MSYTKGSTMESYPFPADIHIKTPPPTTTEHKEALQSLRNLLETNKSENYLYSKPFCSDAALNRFLVARNYNVEKAFLLTCTALEWRAKRKPSDIEKQPGWEEMISKEAETGKIYHAGFDFWKRPVIVFDNSVQNTNSHDAHILFLAWNLELGTRLMSSSVDKYVILINLKKFSLINNPTLQTTKETIKMLCDCFPERLGHLICYQPPWVFKGVFDAVKMFIDPKTVSKVIFLVGDDAEGTANDTTMRTIIGDNWRTLTGAGQPVLVPGCSPGFDFQVYWKDIMARVSDLQRQEVITSQKNVVRANGLEEVLADLSLSTPSFSPSSSTRQRDNNAKDDDLFNNYNQTNNGSVSSSSSVCEHPPRVGGTTPFALNHKNHHDINKNSVHDDDAAASASSVSPRICFLLLVVYIVYLMF